MKLKITLILILSILFFIYSCSNSNKKTSPHKIAYIFTSDETIDTKAINIKQLTHINYAFANLINGKMVEGHSSDSLNLVLLKKLIKSTNPDCKLMVSVGGGLWSNNFSDMAINQIGRELFIRSAVNFIQKYQLDGLDIDWEYPGLKGNNNLLRKEDKQTYTFLLKELRLALDSLGNIENKHFILSTAIPCFHEFYENVEIEKVHPHLDFINLMCYDFYGEWDTISGHQSNLFDNLNTKKMSGDSAIRFLLKSGVPSDKIIYGIPFYSYSWIVKSDNPKSVNMIGRGADYSGSYEEILEKYINKNGFVSHWDSIALVPYLWNDSLKVFVTYEDPRSVEEKCKYILRNNLGGVMFWKYNHHAENLLLNTIDHSFR